jgi:hypothetical protein
MKKTETRYVVERRDVGVWLSEGYFSRLAAGRRYLKSREFDGRKRHIVKVTTTREAVR